MAKIRYSPLPEKEREEAVMKHLEELVSPWKNWLPPQEFNRQKIAYYISKRNQYLGIEKRLIFEENRSFIYK